MNKTILLELTEKEVEVLQTAIPLLNESVENARYAEKESKTKVHEAIAKKIQLALEPKEEVLIKFNDLHQIISLANMEYHRLPLDLHISDQKVEFSHIRHICLASATIMWLNGSGLLKRLAKFDFTDMSCQYEESE